MESEGIRGAGTRRGTRGRSRKRAVAVRNVDIAQQFEQTADALEIQDANPFRVRAYRNAARMLRAYGSEMAELVGQGANLTELPGIGEDLAARIMEIVHAGKSAALQKIQKKVPRFAMELVKLQGVGPRRARTLCEEADIHSLEQLHRAVLDHRVRSLPGFGQKVEDTLLSALQKAKAAGRMKIAIAASYAEALVAHMERAPGVGRVTVAGSFRRGRDTVGDLDILATATNGKGAIEHFVAFDQVGDVLAAGRTRATVVLKSGLQVDLRVVPEASYGAALHYFTGSKAHNIATRRIAQQRGLKLSEYGVFRGKTMIAGATEEDVYAAVGLPFIPPELREDRGEIDAARERRLPKLIELRDLKGDLHTHSTQTDGGHNTIREMAEAAHEMGLEYIAIADHSRRLKTVHGLNPSRLHAQGDAIDRLNRENIGIAVLKGIEVDILEDGSLDLPDDVLAGLDIVVGAVHSNFNLSRLEQTQRIVCAMEHPYLSILAHPSGRLMREREPYDVDMPRIIAAAARTGCVLELNAHPDRLDLSDVHCRQAKEAGVLIAIATDAHGTADLRNLRFGIQQARRGWLEKADILNTRPLAELRKLLKRRR